MVAREVPRRKLSQRQYRAAAEPKKVKKKERGGFVRVCGRLDGSEDSLPWLTAAGN